MYSNDFDLVIERLKEHYSGTSHKNAYAEVRTILEQEGFSWTKGSVYFGTQIA